MNRFKTSKYRNAGAKPAKRENWYLDLHIGNLKLSCGNHIKASTSQMAFNVDFGGGGSLGVLNLDDIGRRDKAPPYLQCHTDFVSDMDFSPFFDESLLATCSYDCSIKLWKLPKNVCTENVPSSPVSVLPIQPNRVENVIFHPTVSEVLGSSCSKTVTIWDLEKCQQKYELSGHADVVQSFSWKADGSLLATSSKDKKIRIFDPRASTCSGEGSGFSGVKDSRVTWLGHRNQILGTGFSVARQRQIVVWDINNLTLPLETLNVDSNTGILMPFYDPDTDMLLLAGKGDSSIWYYEVKESGNPYLYQVSGEMVDFQSKGIASVPKCGMDVMSCEVMRLLQLTPNAIVPISYIVPRKRKKVSLHPSKNTSNECEQKQGLKSIKSTSAEKTPPSKTLELSSTTSQLGEDTVSAKQTVSIVKKTYTSAKTSKFRHIEGIAMHKNNNIENIRNLSMSTFGECDGLLVNDMFVAWLLSGPGGQIAVHPLSKPCRLPDTGLPMIQCGSTVMDFVFDPFNNHRIAAACESGSVSVWDIPKGGLVDIIAEPSIKLKGHHDKPTIVRYHPTASNVLASASADLTIKIWDICTMQCVITLQGHNEQIFSFCWSLDGKHIVSVSRDKKIRLYEPRSSTTCTQMGDGPEGSRGARVFWAGPKSELLVLSGFSRSSERKLIVYNSNNLCEPLQSVSLEVAPSILIPWYDDDTGVVLLSGKAVGFLDKRSIDVRSVEVARGVKLTKTNIELIQFRVPRVKMEYFQDDLYPDTKIKWEPALSSKEWFSGKNNQLKTMSLKPANMESLTDIPKEAPSTKKYDSTRELQDYKSDEQKKEMLVTAMVEKLGNFDEDPLPQDLMEGVEDDEWDD
ncbi:Coronin-7 [Exaiptasia diaphana]|nr:Coronin-7 [Exaiptasia diaphana]